MESLTNEKREKVENDLQEFQLRPLKYERGPVRANYVSPTAAAWAFGLVSEQSQAIAVLSRILDVLQESFDSRSFSYTTGRKNEISRGRQPTARLPEWKRVFFMGLNKGPKAKVQGTTKMVEKFRFKEVTVGNGT